MNPGHVEKIAEAVLYEGYMLYPYRASSVKNQQRWNFGVLAPQAYCEQQKGTEAATMQTECLFHAGPSARLSVTGRFLQTIDRLVGRLTQPLETLPSEGMWRAQLAFADAGVSGGDLKEALQRLDARLERMSVAAQNAPSSGALGRTRSAGRPPSDHPREAAGSAWTPPSARWSRPRRYR